MFGNVQLPVGGDQALFGARRRRKGQGAAQRLRESRAYLPRQRTRGAALTGRALLGAFAAASAHDIREPACCRAA